MPEQVIRTNPPTLSVAENSPFSFGITYNTANPPDSTLSGLGLRLHFDSDVIQFNSVANLEDFGAILVPSSADQIAVNTESANTDDGDPDTDSFIPIGWASLQTAWPGDGETYPLTLYDATFTTLAGFTETTINFTASSTASGYTLDAQSLTLTLAQVGITVNPTAGLTTTEAGGTAAFTVVLDSQPTANVTIPVTSSDTSEGTVAPASVVFTPDNWNQPQTVTVTGVDDFGVDGNQPYTIQLGAATSTDAGYTGFDPADVAVSNTDNDTAGITVAPTQGLITTEAGGTAEFTVVLTSQPTANVTIPVSSSDTSEGTVAPESLVFTAENWNEPQTVTVTGVADDLEDGNQAYTVQLGAATSTDAVYAGFDPTDVSVENQDRAAGSVTVTPTTGLTTTEAGGTAEFTVVLDSQPTADVTIPVSSSDTSEGTVAPESLVFTAENWNEPQTVTVTGVDDPAIDGNQAYTVQLGVATSTDASYAGLDPADVAVTNTDDDTAGITVTPTTGLTTSENGGRATFTVVLDSQPTASVTIAIASSDTSEGTVAPVSVVFTPENWDQAQTVTVSGVDDTDVDGNQTYTVQLAAATSEDANYQGINPADVTVTNTDNDNIFVPPASSFGPSTSQPQQQNTAPTISDIGDQRTIANNPTDTVAFTVSDSETAANNLTVTVTSSNEDLIPNDNIVLGGEGEGRTLQLTPAEGQSGTATITVEVSDGSLTATDTFSVDVIAVSIPSGDVDTLRGGDGGDTFVLGGSSQPQAGSPSGSFANTIAEPSEEFPGQYFGTNDSDRITGSNSDDTLLGFQQDDFLEAQGGSDTLFGGQQNDTLAGNGENDVLYGNKNDDDLFGEEGNDTLYGGQENDTLVGGAGSDQLWGDKGNDVLYGVEGEGYTFVRDFMPNEDTIELSGSAADYQLGTAPEGFSNATAIYRVSSETAGEVGLVAIFQGVVGLNLEDSSIFSFV